MLLCSFRSATHVALHPAPLLTLCFGDKPACPTGHGHPFDTLYTLLWSLFHSSVIYIPCCFWCAPNHTTMSLSYVAIAFTHFHVCTQPRYLRLITYGWRGLFLNVNLCSSPSKFCMIPLSM